MAGCGSGARSRAARLRCHLQAAGILHHMPSSLGYSLFCSPFSPIRSNSSSRIFALSLLLRCLLLYSLVLCPCILLTRSTGLCRRFGKPRPLVTVRHLYRKKMALPLLPFSFTTLLSTSVTRHIAHTARATKTFAVHFTCRRAAGIQAILYFKGMLFPTNTYCNRVQRSLQQCQDR